MKRFQPHYPENMDDMDDSKYFIRAFSGVLTKARFDRIKKWANGHTWYEHCGCPHDCCGCQCEQSAKVTTEPVKDSRNFVTVSVVIEKMYNY